MATRTRTRLPASERRERIFAAATEVFAERGYDAASMGEIAARAGVVASVIYHHVGSKRDLAIELLRQHGTRLAERSLEPPPGLEPRELVRWVTEAFYRLVEEDPFGWRFLFREPPSDPEIAAAWREVDDRARAGITALIRWIAPPDLEIAGVPRETATEMLAKASHKLAKGLAEWWWDHREVPRDHLVEITFALVWNGLATTLGDGSEADLAGS
jgi:AcrR family transcriptional regulator